MPLWFWSLLSCCPFQGTPNGKRWARTKHGSQGRRNKDSCGNSFFPTHQRETPCLPCYSELTVTARGINLASWVLRFLGRLILWWSFLCELISYEKFYSGPFAAWPHVSGTVSQHEHTWHVEVRLSMARGTSFRLLMAPMLFLWEECSISSSTC